MRQTLFLNRDGSFRVGPEWSGAPYTLKIPHLAPLKDVLHHDEADLAPLPMQYREYVKRYMTAYYDIYEEV